MVKLLIKLLGEARGNAVWDAIRRICQWGWPAMLSVLTWFAGWFKHAPTWQVWGMVIIVCLTSYAIAFRLSKKRGLKKETELTPQALTINAHCLQCNNEGILFYCCRVSVRNHGNIAAEKVAVLLQNIDPIPSAKRRVADNHEYYHKPALPLPTIFPIEVRPVIVDGKTIPPDSTIEFNLFKLVRHGDIPTIRFLGKTDQDEFSMFTPETIEGGTIFMFKPYKITLSVQSLNCAAYIQTFTVIFEAGENGKIATFTIVKDNTK
jgi:hypothetical protein